MSQWRSPCLLCAMAYDQNTQTLIATFKDYSTARQAARELINNGVPSDAVHVDSNQKTTGATSGEYQQEDQQSGFMDWWKSLFGSDQEDTELRGYETALTSGRTVLRATVPAQSVDSAIEILNRNGATGMDTSGDTDRQAAATRTESGGAPIQVVEEELQVGKRAVQRGGVRVYSHIVSEQVQENIQLREERVNVARRKVDREISPEEVSALRDQTIEVAEMAEEPVVSKRARVREEVVVGKEATERTETIRGNVRHTEVEVEQLGQESRPSSTSQGTGTAGINTTVKQPTPGVMSGGGMTAGAGTLAGDATAGSGIQDVRSQDFTSNPGYQYGFRNAGDQRYKGKSWDQVENDLRSDYERANPGSTWEQVKSSVRQGWDKVTGKS